MTFKISITCDQRTVLQEQYNHLISSSGLNFYTTFSKERILIGAEGDLRSQLIKRSFLATIWNIQQDCLVDRRDFCTGVILYTILFY